MYGIDCIGPSSVDRGRNATKLSVICDEMGVVLNATFHKGNKADYKAFLHTLSQCRILNDYILQGKIKNFHADKAYDNRRCDNIVSQRNMHNECIRKKKKVEVPHTHIIRNRVEHVFSWLDKFRRIILRYDRLIIHHKSFTYLGFTYRIMKFL